MVPTQDGTCTCIVAIILKGCISSAMLHGEVVAKATYLTAKSDFVT